LCNFEEAARMGSFGSPIALIVIRMLQAAVEDEAINA
jgi:hypothetical protein